MKVPRSSSGEEERATRRPLLPLRDESLRTGPDGGNASGPRLRAGTPPVPVPDLTASRTLTHPGDCRRDFPAGTRISLGGAELGHVTVIAEPVFDGQETTLEVAPDEVTAGDFFRGS